MKNYTFTTGFARITVEAETREKAIEIARGIYPLVKIKDHEQ